MRQAIVLIHGIGEQRPMDSLRAFVASVLSDESGKAELIRSKPDRLSESYELRRLVADGTRSRPTTDFFEYYWAHRMEGNRIGHVWPLARLLLLRWPWTVPVQLLMLWSISWLFILTAIGVGAAIYNEGLDEFRKSQSLWWATGVFVFGLVQLFAARYLGDAARYLSPIPENVSTRQKIRADGVRVLRRMHRSGNYDRIVIVGHSLGSVIGYDIITYLWDQYNTRHNSPDRPKQDALRRVELQRSKLNGTSREQLNQFRLDQRALWQEQRALGNPWLVTDFVTLGSPLTYAAILFTSDAAQLQQRQRNREMPRCPPEPDKGRYAYRSTKYTVNGAVRTLRVLHHAAAFAVTRWTNIYAPIRLGVLGDWIGGPLNRVFGFGIADVVVKNSPFSNMPLVAHTHYWNRKAGTSLPALKTALDLNSSVWLRAHATSRNSQPEGDIIPSDATSMALVQDGTDAVTAKDSSQQLDITAA